MVGAGAIALALAGPMLGAWWLRTDLRQPQPLVWNLAKFAAPVFHDGDHIALLLPGDNRSVAFMLRAAIAIAPPDHHLADFDDFPRADEAALAEALKRDDSFVLISCVPPALAASQTGQRLKLPPEQAVVLFRQQGVWSLLASHAYPDDPDTGHSGPWTPEISAGPFCR
jgi:hypothetical protein